MLKASAGFNNLRIMLPMITHIAEIEEARHWLDQAYTEVIDEGYELQRPPIGVMIEVPATVYQAHQIAKKVDFISVGSNDLTQYLLAVDRDNAQVAELYHAYHPVVLAALQHVALAAKSVRIPVSICGELAGDPGGALLLIAMGYDILSMNSVNIPRIKSVIRNMHFSQAKTMLKLAMQQQDASGVKKIVQQTLHKVGITQAHSFVMRD
jgi:phosphotransferase system, enzyme I, PtsP